MKRFAAAFFVSLIMGLTASGQAPLFKLLVFSATAGYRHASITNGIALIQALGATNNFGVDTTEDATMFNDANLAQYKAVVFLNTTGDVLTNAQQLGALQHYIENGGGYVGVHAASDTLHNWAWYGGLVGAYFVSHPAIQQATNRVEDHIDPSTTMLPAAWGRTDEWYNFNINPRPWVHVLATVDESTYYGGTMGADHPIAWTHYYDGGRAWYTAGGHTPESYSEPLFQQHLLGGIMFAAGIASGHPVLGFSRIGKSMALTWPTGASGFGVETASNLQRGTIWSPITNAPSVQNGQESISLTMSNGTWFFRLRH
jgi:type 1 glutamine amidotransferase